ncbi:hypothetical protein CDV36_016243 [Fusarium kuroshium]|uniref:Uncharacterized protein n=1 Tax=Fusarium kuroshium TaxID=2010991 RepID=A0A3M2QWF1_9HYPO|nr:hypothetical protein CDV36_016243 [Fusarium kuroshium]
MELWGELVQNDTIPTDPTEKLQYNAERLVSSAVVQAYDVVIKEGCAYSTLTNGFARVLLHVPYDDPATLYDHLCEPNGEIDGKDKQTLNRMLAIIKDRWLSQGDREQDKPAMLKEKLSFEEWKVVAVVQKILQPFKVASGQLQGEGIEGVAGKRSTSGGFDRETTAT